MIKPKFVSGLPTSMVPGGLNEPPRPSLKESEQRVARATVYRRYGSYRNPRRSALEMAGLQRIQRRMIGERDD